MLITHHNLAARAPHATMLSPLASDFAAASFGAAVSMPALVGDRITVIADAMQAASFASISNFYSVLTDRHCPLLGAALRMFIQKALHTSFEGVVAKHLLTKASEACNLPQDLLLV